MPLVHCASERDRRQRPDRVRYRVSVATAVLAALLVCCTPTAARGGPIFTFGFPLGDLVQFGSVLPFSSQTELVFPSCAGLATLTSCSSLGGVIELTSGPMVSVLTTADASGYASTSTYQFGAGLLKIQAEWALPGGGTGHGAFSAPIPDFTFTVSELFPEAVVCCDEKLLLGAGLFDDALAGYLGVQPQTPGGVFLLQLTDILGSPGDPLLVGFYNGGNVAIDVVAVPEPSILALTAVAAAMWTRRRRLRRRKSARH
jgi:hypothetical protein